MSDAAALLDQLAGDDEWSRHQALERLRGDGADSATLASLAGALADDEHADRRASARIALAALGERESPGHQHALELLIDSLGAPDPDLRILSASALGEAANPAATRPLVDRLADENENVAAAAADALGQIGDGRAVEPLARAAAEGSRWVRTAAVVALGRIGDPAAIPALSAALSAGGVDRPVVESVRAIGHPDGLAVLAAVHERAPLDALMAAGAILCSHPEHTAPDWVVESAREHEIELARRFREADHPAAARLLGTAGTATALRTLLDALEPPTSSEAALAGLLAAPAGRAAAILGRAAAVPASGSEHLATLLSLLPPLDEPAQVRRIVDFLGHEAAAVRGAAAEALARSGPARALPALSTALSKSASPEVVRALGQLGDQACTALLPLLVDDEPGVRQAAAAALGRCAGGDVLESMLEALALEKEQEVREALVRSMGRLGGEAAVAPLAERAREAEGRLRLAALEGLGATRAADAVPPLEAALRGDRMERLTAARALGELERPEAVGALEGLLRDQDEDVRRMAARGLAALPGEVSGKALSLLARSDDPWLRICAARVLGARAPGGDRLRQMADSDPDARVRQEARGALVGGGADGAAPD